MVQSNRAQRTLLICMHRWKPPRVRYRGLRTSATDQKRPPGDLRTTPRQDSTARPTPLARQYRELKKLFFSPPSKCAIDLFGPVANRAILRQLHVTSRSSSRNPRRRSATPRLESKNLLAPRLQSPIFPDQSPISNQPPAGTPNLQCPMPVLGYVVGAASLQGVRGLCKFCWPRVAVRARVSSGRRAGWPLALRGDNENWARDEAHAYSARKGDARERKPVAKPSAESCDGGHIHIYPSPPGYFFRPSSAASSGRPRAALLENQSQARPCTATLSGAAPRP